jgi:Na+-translocating ferredoxin:NAD+ oxidoreductase subunit B
LTESLAAGLVLALLAAVLSGVLMLAGRWLAVNEDARLERLVALLPGTNCGGCGHPGCRAFASALLEGKAVPAGCSVSTTAARQAVADFLQVSVGVVERRVARLACAGDRDLAPALARYEGEPRCSAAAVVAQGGRSCGWGCLGLGDCERACSFGAIRMSPRGLPVVDEARCTACGDCVRACPKDLFHVVPQAQPLWVACSNPQAGSDLVNTCAAACTACARCVQDAPAFLQLVDNLPRLIPGFEGTPPRAAIERCPTGAIVWFSQGRAQLGACARRPEPASHSTVSLHRKPA